MNTGRNWTRRSIEELIDDFLKKKTLPPTPATGFQFFRVPGKIASTNIGGAYIRIGVTGSSKPVPTPRVNQYELCAELPYRSSVNLEYHARNTYFPVDLVFGSGSFVDLPYAYVLPLNYYPSGVTGTCYKFTRSNNTSLPRIGNSDQNSYFTSNVVPSTIHSIPTSASTTIHPLAFCFGSNDDNLTAIQSLDTAISNVLSSLTVTMAITLLSSLEISDADIQTEYPAISTFQSLTY